ncbi:MAG TPA: PH domain-containing protein [Nocardioidaceae bacterium]
MTSEQRPAGLRRLHPLTPLFRSWRLVGLAGALGLGAFRDDLDRLEWIWNALHGDAEMTVLIRAFLVVGGAALASVALGWLSWRTTGFAIVAEPGEPGTLLYHRGLVNRQRSQLRLKRVQAVDVNQPLIPGLLGLAAVKLDMAAGEGASVNLSYLSLADAWELRDDILRHTSVDAEQARSGLEPRQRSRAEVIGRVQTSYLVKATLLDGAGAWLLLVVWVAGVIVAGTAFGWAALGAALAGILPVTIAIFVLLRQQVTTILRDADFTVMRTPTGIRTRAGLTSTTNRSIDLDRVQELRIERPMLWRWLGWARVDVDVAGAGEARGASLMPVAPDAVAGALAADVAGEVLEPMRTDGIGRAPEPFVGPGARARLLDPLAWRWYGVALLERGAVTRTGWRTRTVSYVPYARVQSVSARQGWLQRRLGLATVCLDMPSGTVRWVAPHRDVIEAAELVTRLSEQARRHRMPNGWSVASEPAGDAGDRSPDDGTQHDAAHQPSTRVEHRPREVRQPDHEECDHDQSRDGQVQRRGESHEHEREDRARYDPRR